MSTAQRHLLLFAAVALLVAGPGAAGAAPFVQCPGDTDGDAIPELGAPGYDPDVRCKHLAAGDGFVTMADGTRLYMFSFSDITGVPELGAIAAGSLAANFSAPNLVMRQGEEWYLTLTNVGMVIRPDLFDPHTVHFHGFPQASDVFDGVPEATLSINQGASFTYYYKLQEPGTHMYHCHVEATEHMQMGMLGNLYVLPVQNDTGYGGDPGTVAQLGGNPDPSAPLGYVFNDGDGTTAYDVEYAIQLGSFDGDFHNASESVQPLPFANMDDDYPMMNGRGYPDTTDVRTDGIAPFNPLYSVIDPVNVGDPYPATPGSGAQPGNPVPASQPVSSLVAARQGQRILLRLSNLNVTNFYTITALGLPMKVIGEGARQLRGPGGVDVAYDTASITIGGGEAMEVMIDTTDIPVGTYFLYTTNMNFLSNSEEDFGGMMTHVEILPAI